MEINQYNNLFVYLTLNTFPLSFNSQKIAKLKRQSKFFKVKNDLLYKGDKKNPEKLLRVIKMSELEAILFMMHNDPTAGHFSTDIMFNKIRTRYYWPQMYEILEYTFNLAMLVREEEDLKIRMNYILFQ